MADRDESLTDTQDEFSGLLSRLLRKAMMILQARAAMISLMRPDGSRLIPARVALGIGSEQTGLIDVERLRSFAQSVITTGTSTILKSRTECTGAFGDAIGSMISSCLCVPLIAHAPKPGESKAIDPIVGLLVFLNKSNSAPFDDEDMNLAAVLGRQVAAVLFEQQRREGIL